MIKSNSSSQHPLYQQQNTHIQVIYEEVVLSKEDVQLPTTHFIIMPLIFTVFLKSPPLGFMGIERFLDSKITQFPSQS